MNSSSSPNAPNRLPILFVLLLAFVPPSVASFTQIPFITQHPWLFLGGFLLYEMVLFFLSLAFGVWQQLWNDKWKESIVDWVDLRVRGKIFKYENIYRKQLRERHRYVQMRSLITQGTYSLELNEVFVLPKLSLTTPQQATTNLLKLPKKRLSSGKHTLWDYLASADQHLVILGAPGSGKSTLLQELVLSLVSQERRRQKSKILYTLPFLLTLRTISEILKDNPSFSLVDAVKADVSTLKKRPVLPEWVENQLTNKQCLILLDGLDEIADSESRKQVADWVQQQMGNYGNNRFVVTSRPYGYENNPFDGVTTLAIEGFTQRQIDEFITKWYVATEFKRRQKDENTRVKAEVDAQDLLQRLSHTPALLELACNPLLLTMMAIIHIHRGALPGSRGELYDEMCKVLLERRTRWEYPSGQKQRILQKLAYYMMKQGIEEIEPDKAQLVIKEPLAYISVQITPEAFLETVAKDGIWIEGEKPGTYRFTHKTFQEYLTAMYVCENKEVEVQTLVDHIGSDWWRETIFLYCTKADATPIMKACLKGNYLLVDAVELALDLEMYERQVAARSDVREQFTSALSQTIENGDPKWQRKIAEKLLARRLQHMSRMASLADEMSIVVDTSLVSCAEYQLFLDEHLSHGLDHCPDHWTNHHFPPGQGLAPILGIRPYDAITFCNWLTERSTSGTWLYRLPRSSEQEEEHVGTVDRVLAGTGYWISDDIDCTWEGEQSSLNYTVSELLDRSFKEDSERARNYREGAFQLNRRIDQIYYESSIFAGDLIKARNCDYELFSTLQSIHELTHVHEQTLWNKFQEAKQRIRALEYEHQEAKQRIRALKYELKQEAKGERINERRNIELRISDIQRTISVIHTESEEIQKHANELQDHQEEAEQKVKTLRFDLAHENRKLFFKDRDRVRNLEDQLEDAQKRVASFQDQLVQAWRKKEDLDKQLTKAQAQEEKWENELRYPPTIQIKQRKSKLDEQLAQTQQRERELDEQLARARQRESQLQDQFNLFHNYASTIDEIWIRASAIGHTHDLDKAFSDAFARNHALNLDRILNIVKDSALKDVLENTPAQVSERALAYAQGLVQALTTININTNEYTQAEVDSIALALTQAQVLVSDLERGYTGTNVRDLAYMLMLCLERILKNRSTVRRESELRWYIRYFARILFGHLLYWGRSEQLLQGDIDWDIIDIYLDIYITFVILEERIRGKLPVCEGILLVMEPKEGDQE